jgi:LAO/AO transport system kinase
VVFVSLSPGDCACAMKPFFVYMLRCADGSYYLGHTDDLDRRVAQHDAGEIDGYTHERRPVQLVWSQETATREEALVAERRIKGWARAKKEALIRGDWHAVQRHAWGTRNPLPPELAAKVGPSIAQHDPGPSMAHVLRQAQDGSGPSIPQDERGDVRVASVRSPMPQERGDASAASVRPEVSKDDLALLDALAGNPGAMKRRALAKAITLIESSRADHRAQADALLDALLPSTGRSLRLGISGVPGVGKSTFIEALGLFLIERGHRVAVLAVDPSSSVSGGSILGDKTRMERLSVQDAAFIRPSPTSGALGGVAEHTRETLLVCEAAGFDIVVVETVGVGQSEIAVAGMTDLFVLMQLPNAGDDLQAIKRGVMELANLVVINKADLDDAAATRAQAQITSALRVFGFHGNPTHVAPAPVHKLSALKGEGLDAFWAAVQGEAKRRRDSGAFEARRRAQRQAWLWDIVHARLRADFEHDAAVRKALPRVLAEVNAARTAPTVAARALLDLFEKN